MPLRRWFNEHGLPGWYSWLVLFLTTIASIGISIAVNTRIAHRTIEQAQAAERTQAERTRIATCLVVVTQDQAFQDSPPVTAAGKRAADAWHLLSLQLRCDHQ